MAEEDLELNIESIRAALPCRRPAEQLVMLLLLLATMIANAAAGERVLLVMGDSLSAAYGLRSEQGWVHMLQERLAEQEAQWRVVNASISGETTAGGASRVAQEIARHRPDAVLIALGANDGLRGLPLDAAQANLQRMIDAAREAGAEVLLVGMQMPPNYGPDYTRMFQAMYRELAERNRIALLPFLLEPIATEREAFMADNLHPVASAQLRLLDHVWPALEPVLQQAAN
jgi:acyl-CoA thioesterase I